MPTNKLALLKSISFGAQVAEEETAELATYFVATDQWLRIFKGDIDVVRGHKGSGKSAIYSLLLAKSNDLFDKGIILATGERPRGAPVFKELVVDPPAAEAEFVSLWKLYIAAVIGQKMLDFGISGEAAEKFYKSLSEQNLLQNPKTDLSRIFRSVRDYASRRFNAKALEGTVAIDPNTGIQTWTGKITAGEPAADRRDKGFISLDHLLGLANAALIQHKYSIWVLMDRLDVAFAETHDLEKNALRALFRAYLDISGLDNIRVKIFLRSDIWNRIVEGGFREASHITRVVILEWTPASLLNLIMRRLLKNQSLVDYIDVNKEQVLSDFEEKSVIFYRVFPDQVDQGSRKPKAFDWMITRTADATDKTAPRELIHLLIVMREQEIARLERGESDPTDDRLFDRSVFKSALPAVSEARLIQNLYAEYPDLKKCLEALAGEKTEQTLDSLSKIWGVDTEETQQDSCAPH